MAAILQRRAQDRLPAKIASPSLYIQAGMVSGKTLIAGAAR
jgi:hypothetical protein